MRIVISSLQYHPDAPSGANRLAFDEAAYLAGRGHEVWHVASDPFGSLPPYAEEHGVRILRYPAPQYASWDPRRIRAHQRRTADLLSRFLPRDVDVIHGHTLLSYDGARGYFGCGPRTCYSVHSPVKLELLAGANGRLAFRNPLRQVRTSMASRIERRCISTSDAVTVFSAYTRDVLRKIHSLKSSPDILIVPGWVDLDRFRICDDRQALKQSLHWPVDRPVFFTLRRMVPRMGIDNLLRASHELRSSGERFFLVLGGDGPLRARFEAMAGKLGLGDSLSFIGRVPEDLLPSMYAAADAFVLPSSSLECFGLIALEALACGRPVLATPVGAIPEVVGRIEPGWMAADASGKAIAGLLLSYLRSSLPSHEPSALREAVSASYSKDLCLGTLEHVLMGTAGQAA